MARRRSVAGLKGGNRQPGPARTPAGRTETSASKGGGRGATSENGDSIGPEALVVTYCFDPGETGEAYSAAVRLTGRRAGVGGRPKSSDAFVREEAIAGVLPGSGPVSVSSVIEGVEPGEWSVAAELIRPTGDAGSHISPEPSRRPHIEPMRTARWSWRLWRVSPGPSTVVVKTRWALLAPLARRPAVVPGSLPLLVIIGGFVAVLLQGVLVGNRGLSVPGALVVSLLASVSGLIGAKVWHQVLNPQEPILKPGWAVDGFLVIAPLVAVAALLALDIPVGEYLDASTPGLFFTVALGRVGCFLTGCCGGRPTSSRWGVWSCDGRIGARRVPTQLLESGVGLTIGLTTLTLVLGRLVPAEGGIFVAAFLVYLAVRQFLLRLRARPRKFLWQRIGLVEHTS